MKNDTKSFMMGISCWIGSIVFGWLHLLLWLIVPLAYHLFLIIKMATHAGNVLKSTTDGRPPYDFYKLILVDSSIFVIWNMILNGVLFGLAWYFSS